MIFYTVGGAVRDRLLGVEPKDIDRVIVGATVDDLRRLIADEGFNPVGSHFNILLSPNGIEHAVARAGAVHDVLQDVDPNVTIEQDLHARDFTINAIAYDEDTKQHIDPLNGISDVRRGILRMCNPDCFRQDPLRILRAARFVGQDFQPTEELFLQACESVGWLSDLPTERTWAELMKVFATPRAHDGIEFLRHIGAGPILAWGQALHRTNAIDIKVVAQQGYALLAMDYTPSRGAPVWAESLWTLGEWRFASHVVSDMRITDALIRRLGARSQVCQAICWARQMVCDAHHTEWGNPTFVKGIAELLNVQRGAEKLNTVARMAISLYGCMFGTEAGDRVYALMNEVLTAISAVNASDSLALGLSGSEVGDWIRRQSIIAIGQMLEKNKPCLM